jgi:hypothetical protein
MTLRGTTAENANSRGSEVVAHLVEMVCRSLAMAMPFVGDRNGNAHHHRRVVAFSFESLVVLERTVSIQGRSRFRAPRSVG